MIILGELGSINDYFRGSGVHMFGVLGNMIIDIILLRVSVSDSAPRDPHRRSAY